MKGSEKEKIKEVLAEYDDYYFNHNTDEKTVSQRKLIVDYMNEK